MLALTPSRPSIFHLLSTLTDSHRRKTWMVPTLTVAVRSGVSRPMNLIFIAAEIYHIFVEAGDMKRLSGKLLVDTYSKRSQTLIEKVPKPHFVHSPFVLT